MRIIAIYFTIFVSFICNLPYSSWILSNYVVKEAQMSIYWHSSMTKS